MARTRAELRVITLKMEEFIRQFPGLGLVGIVFDAVSRVPERPTNMMIFGIKEDEAVRMLRDHTDLLERVAKGEQGRLAGEDSLIVAPSFMDFNKLKGN